MLYLVEAMGGSGSIIDRQQDLLKFRQRLANQGPKLTFFSRCQLTTKFVFQSPNGKMLSPKSVSKTLWNTSQNYWSPRACDKISAEIKPVLKSSFDHFDRSTLPPTLPPPREYLNIYLVSSWMFRLYLVINCRKISEHLWTPHCLNKYSWQKNA